MIRTNSLLQIMHVNLDRNSSSTDEFVLAAKFLTKRVLNVEATGRTFKPLWNTRRDFMRRVVLISIWCYFRFLDNSHIPSIPFDISFQQIDEGLTKNFKEDISKKGLEYLDSSTLSHLNSNNVILVDNLDSRHYHRLADEIEKDLLVISEDSSMQGWTLGKRLGNEINEG